MATPLNSDRLGGLIAAVATPLDGRGAIDDARFAEHCRWLMDRGCHGLTPFGTSGESTAFSVAERRTGLDRLIQAGIPAACLVPGTGATAAPDAIELTRHAVERGCAGVLLLPSFYWKEQPDEYVFRFFAEVVEGVADPRLRLYLYQIPQLTAVPIRIAAIRRLRDRYGAVVAGLKDSSGDLAGTIAYIRELPDLAIMTGSEEHIPDVLKAGGTGTICGLANLIPSALREIVDRPEGAKTADIVAGIKEIVDAVFRQPVIPALKYATGIYRNDPNWRAVRAPLVALTASQGSALTRDLGACRMAPAGRAAAAQ
jgi:4-hydroxy-tetrahydrodipicolinate synthase